MNRIRHDQEFEMMCFESKNGSVSLQGPSTKWARRSNKFLDTSSAECVVARQLLQVLSGITYGAGEIIGLELLADDYELGLPIGEQVRSRRGSIIL
jgi:hypothetical protein